MSNAKFGNASNINGNTIALSMSVIDGAKIINVHISRAVHQIYKIQNQFVEKKKNEERTRPSQQ